MKVLTRTALALAMLASTAGVAFAQDHGDHEGRWGQSRGEPQASPRSDTRAPQQAREAATMGGWQRDANGHNWRGAPAGRVEGPPVAALSPPALVVRDRHDGDRFEGRPGGDRDDRRAWGSRDRDEGRGWRNEDRREQGRPAFRDNDDWRWRSENRYRGWDYRPPSGYYARTWGFGDLLPRAWWAPDYQIVQWWSYGLPRPAYGYQWIRVGDDALLIDRYSGRVCRVVYDVFW